MSESNCSICNLLSVKIGSTKDVFFSILKNLLHVKMDKIQRRNKKRMQKQELKYCVFFIYFFFVQSLGFNILVSEHLLDLIFFSEIHRVFIFVWKSNLFQYGKHVKIGSVLKKRFGIFFCIPILQPSSCSHRRGTNSRFSS